MHLSCSMLRERFLDQSVLMQFYHVSHEISQLVKMSVYSINQTAFLFSPLTKLGQFPDSDK